MRGILSTCALCCALIALVAGGCGGEIEGDVCRQAVAKHSACVDEADPFAAKLKIEGPCND